ncbi:MAG: type II toxin-antitoxin system Phd/YefM family antitoxin [Candidatus Coatesbacteria bacterium]
MAVNVHEAKTHLSKLLNRVAAGEEIVIARYGRPAARMVPIRKVTGPRQLGGLKGKIHIAGDFDAPLPAKLLRRFHGAV